MTDTTPNDRVAADLHKHILATPHTAHDASPDISVTATAIALFDLIADEIANQGYPPEELFATFAGVASGLQWDAACHECTP